MTRRAPTPPPNEDRKPPPPPAPPRKRFPSNEEILAGESTEELIESLAKGLAEHIAQIESDGKGSIKIVFE